MQRQLWLMWVAEPSRSACPGGRQALARRLSGLIPGGMAPASNCSFRQRSKTERPSLHPPCQPPKRSACQRQKRCHRELTECQPCRCAEQFISPPEASEAIVTPPKTIMSFMPWTRPRSCGSCATRQHGGPADEAEIPADAQKDQRNEEIAQCDALQRNPARQLRGRPDPPQ